MPPRPDQSIGRDLGGACILVIDDEAGVRRIVRRMLSESCCRIVEAANGLEGLEAVEHERTIDLVLTDLSMPKVGGLAVVEVLGRCRPELPVAVMSGDGADMRGGPEVPFLRKPFTAEELIRLVTDLVGNRHRSVSPLVPPRLPSADRPALPVRARYRAPPR